jgi:NADH-quinone oxidoreductase subunit G
MKITIDGKEIEAIKGEFIITAALREGIDIPHLCHHPRLKRAGNCRMCMVEIEGMKKLEISCGMPVWENMVVFTDNERVRKARQVVLEFLLLHHPLDCPVCDQCGECKLQDYCARHGAEKSRYKEEKITHPPITLGKTMSINQNRCIKCTRCIRFFRDLTNDEPLCISERGGHSIVGPYMDVEVDNPFSVNTVDLCPTGALTETHFRFKARPWLMSRKPTICPGCSRGCNVTAWIYKGDITRLTPRTNEAVNLEWMCDAGRVTFDAVSSKERLTRPMIKGEPADAREVLNLAIENIRKTNRSQIGVVGSSSLTNEDNFGARQLALQIGTDKIYLIESKKDEKPFGPMPDPLPDWFIRDDKTPNSRGALDMLGKALSEKQLGEDLKAGRLKGLLVFGADPAAAPGDRSIFGKLDWLFVQDFFRTDTVRTAHLFLPESSPFEKDGTFTNENGRVQRIFQVVSKHGDSRSSWETASTLAEMLDGPPRHTSAAEVFDAAAKSNPLYNNLSFSQIDEQGVFFLEKE